jgi:hypothetical protein
LFLRDFNAVVEFDAGYYFRQLILPIEPPPRALRKRWHLRRFTAHSDRTAMRAELAGDFDRMAASTAFFCLRLFPALKLSQYGV